jgi:preprotein translocase subunit SecY
MSLRVILILSVRMLLGTASGILPSHLPAKLLYVCLISYIFATYLTHLMFLVSFIISRISGLYYFCSCYVNVSERLSLCKMQFCLTDGTNICCEEHFVGVDISWPSYSVAGASQLLPL